MTGRADLNVKIAFLCRLGLKRLATRTRDADLIIFRMNSWLHFTFSLPTI